MTSKSSSDNSEALTLAAESFASGASKAVSWIGTQTASAVNISMSPRSSSSRVARETVAFVAAASLATGAALTYAMLNYEKWLSNKTGKYSIPADIAASPFHEHVRLAIKLALKAGENMRTYCDEKGTFAEHSHDLNVTFKGRPEDFCTKIDVENEHLLMEGIREVFPTHKIIGEEMRGTGGIPPLTKYPTWILDPIDGTINFASGLPMCCVSIGFCLDRKPLMGVVYAPMTDELYIGVVGYGAFRNAVKIMPTKKDTPLREAVVCFEFGYVRGRKEVSTMIGIVEKIMIHGCRTSRQIGSGVLDLCYVATGRLDVVYAGVAGDGWKPWDLCAGYVIASEAGCVMESFQQKDSSEFDLYSQNHICATNKGLLEDIRTFVKEEWHELEEEASAS
mmetsp:Transcript_14216/g.18553  ORF Transcript_14216/g.18553 Transcript_14216/m.18553 type:complete len:393 (+) Transcript_14216:54-1232(+)|eukprot:CAMPEP_0198145546 /NCGR_PEP_ID=MMETSP1443-20131203/24251_1 /TAXON_ID=186043 /ORGANISM="Entomoneis sp., Strain CCMP2396" /LENGTH=392 /DNA_ID=CAMNT_0043809233 /DNA_START=39 /DNA_END=1217 /DNA_ORIENTATION=-